MKKGLSDNLKNQYMVAKVGEFDAVIPQITGSAYLTGDATYVIDPDDPLKYGFKVGSKR